MIKLSDMDFKTERDLLKMLVIEQTKITDLLKELIEKDEIQPEKVEDKKEKSFEEMSYFELKDYTKALPTKDRPVGWNTLKKEVLRAHLIELRGE